MKSSGKGGPHCQARSFLAAAAALGQNRPIMVGSFLSAVAQTADFTAAEHKQSDSLFSFAGAIYSSTTRVIARLTNAGCRNEGIRTGNKAVAPEQLKVRTPIMLKLLCDFRLGLRLVQKPPSEGAHLTFAMVQFRT